MKRESFFTSREISDYLDRMSDQGHDLKNCILLIDLDYFNDLPNIKPNAIDDLDKTIYGVDFKLIKDLETDYILKNK